MDEIRFVELKGAPRAMGEAHGEMWRGEIREFVDCRLEHAREFVERYAPGRRLSREDVLRGGEALLDAHRAYDADVWAEFEGIGRGADIPLEELLVCNGLTDIRDWLLLSDASGCGPSRARETTRERGDPGGCTLFIADAAAAGGAPLLGQTWDMHPDARHFLLVQRRIPERGPAVLTLTTVGCLPLIGINEHRVGVGTSNLVPTDVRIGVSYLFTITRALRERGAEEAAGVIEHTPRASGHSYAVVDMEAGLNVEATARLSVRSAATSDSGAHGVHVHANHYVADDLAPLACGAIDPGGSRWRRRRLEEGLRSAGRPLTPATCWSLLADATRGEGAVCNEDYEGLHGQAATAATVVLVPREGVMLACAGGARLGKRVRYTVHP